MIEAAVLDAPNQILLIGIGDLSVRPLWHLIGLIECDAPVQEQPKPRLHMIIEKNSALFALKKGAVMRIDLSSI